MARQTIALKRFGNTRFNTLPLGELAEAVIDSVAGVINPRTERIDGETVFVSFCWMGTSPLVIDNDSLNRFGLCLADVEVAAYANISDDSRPSIVPEATSTTRGSA